MVQKIPDADGHLSESGADEENYAVSLSVFGSDGITEAGRLVASGANGTYYCSSSHKITLSAIL